MRPGKTRLFGGLLLAAAMGMPLSSARAAAPLANFPYLPGDAITQIEEGGGHLFAVTGYSVWVDQDVGGHFLYSRHPDSASWTLVRRAPASRNYAPRGGPIRFQGSLGARAFFNLEDTNAYLTGNGGATFTQVADLPFQSNVAALGGLAFAVLDNAVHSSADSGLTWTRTSTQLAAEQLVSIDGVLYARGDKIWRSDDSGRTWQARMENLTASVSQSGIYRLHLYQNLLVASTSAGTYSRTTSSTSWTPLGSGFDVATNVFSFGKELTGESNTRFHRYDPVNAAWKEHLPWDFGKPMGIVNLGYICGIVALGPRWIVGDNKGLLAFDTVTSDFAWFDAGIHRAAYANYGALSGSLVAAHRFQLFAVPPGGIPTLLRDFRKPGTRFGDISLVSTEPSDSVLWVASDSTLYRLEKSGGIPSIRDSVRVAPGKYFGHGRDLIGVIGIALYSSLQTDTVLVRVSRDAGATFREFPHRLHLPGSSSFSGLGKIVTAYIWNDTAWLWDGHADYHAFDLVTGAYRFGETSIPPLQQTGALEPQVQALATAHGMVVKHGPNILASADGGLTWNLGTRGISGTLAEGSRIQKHAGRLYLSSGDTLYHTGEADIHWSKIDLKALAGASAGVSRSLASREGIYVHRIAQDVVLLAWSDVPTSARPIISAPSARRKRQHPALPRGQGVIFLRNGVGYSIEGRVVR